MALVNVPPHTIELARHGHGLQRHVLDVTARQADEGQEAVGAVQQPRHSRRVQRRRLSQELHDAVAPERPFVVHSQATMGVLSHRQQRGHSVPVVNHTQTHTGNCGHSMPVVNHTQTHTGNCGHRVPVVNHTQTHKRTHTRTYTHTQTHTRTGKGGLSVPVVTSARPDTNGNRKAGYSLGSSTPPSATPHP